MKPLDEDRDPSLNENVDDDRGPSEAEPDAVTAPQPAAAAGVRPYQVVAGLDFSELGDRAVLEALRLCNAQRGAVVHVITVGADSALGVRLPGARGALPMADAEARTKHRVARIVDQYQQELGSLHVDKIAVYVSKGFPAERIVALAASLDADLIVLGTHGREGLKRLFLGSVAEEVVRYAPCGVWVIRPRDFLQGEKLPEVQPPLQPGEHPLLPFREQPTYHYINRMSQVTPRLML